MSRITRRDFLSALPPMVLGLTGMARVSRGADEPAITDAAIANVLEPLRKDHHLIGLSAAIASPGKPTRVGAVGARKTGSAEAFTTGDLVHLGSDTKAMTATMIASLVEEGKLSWTSTLGDIVPEPTMNESFKSVTLDQLLTHRAGLAANGPWWELGSGSTTDQRKKLLQTMTSREPESKPGTAFLYSNLGYALAGLMAETVTGQSWETLMKDHLFEPLGMASAGFGAPGTKGKVDQPWGHIDQNGKREAQQFDNAAALGPAGTVHCTMNDWAKFANLHLQGARGETTPILKPETFRALQTPRKGEDYAKGWIVAKRPWAGGVTLSHNGSNTLWFASIWLAPKKNFALMAATNLGGDAAAKATDSAVAGMIPLAR